MHINPVISESSDPQMNIDEAEISIPEKNRPTLTMPKLSETIDYGNIHFAAEITGYSVSHIRLLSRKGEIPRHKPTGSGTYRFYRTELEDWKNNGMKISRQEDESSLLSKQRKKK